MSDSELDRNVSRDEKVFFIRSSSRGRLPSTSEGLQQKAKYNGKSFADILNLKKALTREVVVEQAVSAEIVNEGKEDGQVVGYLEYGSMVVVNQSADMLGSTALAEVESINPTSGGRMVFGKLLGEDR